MMRCCRAVPLLLAAVAAQRRGSNYHKGLDDASGLEVAFTSRLSPLYRWACAKAKVGDAIAIEHSGWWGPDWSRQFDANGDEPLTYVLGQANILKGLSLAVIGMCAGEEVEATLPPQLAFDHPMMKRAWSEERPKPVPDGELVLYRIKLVEIVNGTAPDDLPKLKKGAQAKAFELTPTMKNYAAAAALALVIAYFVYGALKGPGKPAAKAKPKASKKHR